MDIEDKVRQEIRDALTEAYFYRKSNLHESYAISVSPGEFSQIFIEPFKNAFKNAFVELKKVTSEALTVIRLAFTLNQKKAEEIVARQKDRMAQFEKESEEIFQALGGNESARDYNMMMFLLNPADFAFKTLSSAGTGAVDFAKQIGLGDISIATVSGEEKAEDALQRRRDQDGPVTKLLRNLEQIFFLAHAEKQGNVLLENANLDTFETEILDGPLGNIIESQRAELENTLSDLIELIESIAAQNAFLSVAARVDTAKDPKTGLQQMQEAIARLKMQDPEAAAQFESLPKEINDEALALSKDKKFQEDVVSDLDKDADAGDVDFLKHALHAVMGAAFADAIGDYIEAIDENNSLLESTIESVLPIEITSELLNNLDNITPGFSKAILEAEKVLQKSITT